MTRKVVGSQPPHGQGAGWIVTLSLMILLTVIAVGLLTLASISLRASNRTAAMAEAQQNARLALTMALGELEIRNQTPTGNNPSRIWSIGTNSAFIPANAGEAAVFNSVIFRIRSSSLAPGEARAYTIAAPVYRTRASGTQKLVVDLAAFQSSSPFDFSKCIELENPNPIAVATSTPSMDVRESWQTTLVMLEMRLAGSSTILRRLERFERDNGFFNANKRQFTKDEAIKVTAPFPLILYGFQVSQPGADYKQLMPSTYHELGQRGSTLRTFADFNLQATRLHRPPTGQCRGQFLRHSFRQTRRHETIAHGL